MRLALLLAVVSLVVSGSNLDTPRAGFLQTVLESHPPQNSCKPTGLIQDSCCDFETAEQVNDDLYSGLNQLVETPFFRYHKVDLFRECPFWQEDGSCMNRACGVETTDEAHIPEEWRSHKLSEIKPEEQTDGNVVPAECSTDDSDFCVLEDEMDSEGVYVDLLQNPERFTGYAGASSSRVWKAIYEENCFTPVPFIDPARPVSEGGTGYAPLHSSAGVSGLGGLSGPGGWKEEEKKLLGSLAGPRDGGDEICLEKRVFYRLISGLHASISIHICDDYLDQSTGLWSPNLECFITRIAQHPERLQNVYFSYVLLLRALSKAGPELVKTLEGTTGSQGGIDGTRGKLEKLVQVANGCPTPFDETSMFTGPSAIILKTEFKEHFRNVSRIMDCVGCDKCRLWGKLQITGLGTALKLLFSPNEEGAEGGMSLSRGEAVAFINTVHRFSESLHAVEKFRTLWGKRDELLVAESGAVVMVEEVQEEVRQETPNSPVEDMPIELEVRSILENFTLSPTSLPNPSSATDPAHLPQTQKSHPSPLPLRTLLLTRFSRLEHWFSLCRDSWGRCLDLVWGFAGEFQLRLGGFSKEEL